MSEFENENEVNHVTEEPIAIPTGSAEEFDIPADAPQFVAPDPNQVINICTSSGERRYVPADAPMKASDVLNASGLFIGGNIQLWLNGVQINHDALVPNGSTLTLIGAVKGGTI
jgi:hypothetical protein